MVPECAWAPVVELYGQSEGSVLTERCTGIYVGDRVILTAAHCVPRGYSVPVLGAACTAAIDCPSLDEYDNVIDLDCDPLDAAVCTDPDLSYSNRIRYALFGEAYTAEFTDTKVRKAALVAYCHRINDQSGDIVAGTNDFAYCVLTEEPNVQPVHPMMHCEADLFLGTGTAVQAVGFGQFEVDVPNGADTGGTKRTATASISDDSMTSAALTFDPISGWIPGDPTYGDSGGPLLIRLPDLTWRTAGVALTTANDYATVWPHMAWIATDPNVNIAGVLPCHTTAGQWSPGPNCTGFMLEPGVAQGAWGRAPQACNHTNLSGALNSCGMMAEVVDSPPSDFAVAPREPAAVPDAMPTALPGVEPEGPPSEDVACAASVTAAPRSAGRHTLLLILLVARRRRNAPRASFTRGAALLACGISAGCVQGEGGSGADTTGGTDGPCFENLPEVPPAGNPDFVGTISGEAMPNQRATRVVSANIARTANDAACCQDFVVAGGTNLVQIKFAAPRDGLTFLANRADESVSIGASTRSVLDLAVADLNGDNRNDLAVLRDDKVVVVALAVAAPPVNGPYFALTSVWPMANAGYVAGSGLDLGDMDGDGDLDLFVTSTTTRILWRKNNGNGTFAAASNSAAGLTTQNIVMAQVNAGTQADALVSGSDGRFAYLRSTGVGFAAAAHHRVWAVPATTTGMLITAGRFCPGHATAISVGVAAFDIVKVACGDGAGNFANVLEPHGMEEGLGAGGGVVNYLVDYVWDATPDTPVSTADIKDLAVWTPANGVSELYALYSGLQGFFAEWKVPGTCGFESVGIPLARWGTGTFQSMVVHREARGDSSWGGISCAGSFGLLSLH